MKAFLIVVPLAFLALIVLAAGYVRLAPSHQEDWHVDPTDASIATGFSRFLVRADGDLNSPRYELASEDLLAKFQQIALQNPRTRQLFGQVETGRLTFRSRSALWGFPDYTTVEVLDLGGGRSALVIFARSRFGKDN